MQAKLKIADSYFNMEMYDEALKEYQRIIQQHPDHPNIGEAQYGLALVYKVTGKYDAYLAATREFIETHPQSPLSIAAQYQIGEQYFQQGEFSQAIAAYQWILERFPDNEYADNAMYRIGQSYVQQENLATAVSVLKDFLAMYPNSEFRPAAQYEIANTYFKMLEFEMAAQEYQTFIQSFPADTNIPPAMLNYGFCALQLNQLPEATKVFEQLAQRFPMSAQAKEAGGLMGEIFVEQLRCQEAEQAFAAVISGTEPTRAAQAQLKIAACYERSSELDKAISEYLKVIYVYSSQKVEVDRATYASAGIYEKQGKIAEARNLYKKLSETSTDRDLVQRAKQKLQELQ
jgi:TolA-binding protein